MVDNNTYVWYKNSKFGASNALSVVSQIQDENGNPYKGSKQLPKMELQTELVYDDDSPAPERPICPLRDRNKKNPKLILNRLNGESKLSRMNHPVEFVFRIEEVIFHHSGRKGFKLNVSLVEEIPSLLIHQAPMDDIIVVLSKPRSKAPQKGNMKRIYDNLSSNNGVSDSDSSVIDSENSSKDVMLVVPPNDDNHSNVRANEKKETTENAKVAILPLGAVIDSYRCLDTCYCCNAIISVGSFLDPTKHTNDCIFANQVLPLLTMMGAKQITNHSARGSSTIDGLVHVSSPIISTSPSSHSEYSREGNNENEMDVDYREVKGVSLTSLTTTKSRDFRRLSGALPCPNPFINEYIDDDDTMMKSHGFGTFKPISDVNIERDDSFEVYENKITSSFYQMDKKSNKKINGFDNEMNLDLIDFKVGDVLSI